MTTYILIPTYNEALNVPLLAKNILNIDFQEQIKIIFVDDNSSDNTVELLKLHFKGQNFRVLQKKENKGPGDSFNQGFERILQDSNNINDIVITMEADNTSDFSILNRMITNSKLGYDLVLASVYAQGGGFEKTSFIRILLSFFANMFFRAFFNVKVLTLSSFYRIYKISLLKKIKEKHNIIIEEKGFISMLEILVKSIKCNAEIIEIPMILKSENRKGKSKMKIVKTSVSYLKFFVAGKIKIK